MTLRFIGGWGNREDSLESCTRRLLVSLENLPSEPGAYGPWGVWEPLGDGVGYEFAPVDSSDPAVLEQAIASATERTFYGPAAVSGQIIELIREPRGEHPPTSPSRFEYAVRAGFVSMKRPFNHVLLEADTVTDESLVTRIMSALVIAWEPDRLGVATDEVQTAQGQTPPQALVGWLTYVKAGTDFDTNAVDDQVVVSEADGGLYINIPGTPENPSMDHIRQVRTALGYPNSS